MSAEDLRGRGDGVFYIREETVTSTLGAFQTNPQGFMEETTALVEQTDPVLVKILKARSILTRKRNAANDLQLDRVRRGQFTAAALLTWRVFYNENASLPPISTSMLTAGYMIAEQDIKPTRLTNPHFYDFVIKTESEAPIPRMFRLGAMLVYSLKQAAYAEPSGSVN